MNTFIKNSNKLKMQYDTKPKYCEYCKIKLSYDKRNNKFCNQSCSASSSNKGRNRHNKIYKESLCQYCKKSFFSKKNPKQRFCSIACSTKFDMDRRYSDFIKKWKNNELSGVTGKIQDCDISNHIRRYLFEKFDSKCSKCGWAVVNIYTKKIPLHIEHKDGNSYNNKEENLDLLCPNCHSLTPTYGILNKGKGRKYFRKRYKNSSLMQRQHVSSTS